MLMNGRDQRDRRPPAYDEVLEQLAAARWFLLGHQVTDGDRTLLEVELAPGAGGVAFLSPCHPKTLVLAQDWHYEYARKYGGRLAFLCPACQFLGIIDLAGVVLLTAADVEAALERESGPGTEP